ncbi:hypothetical protein TanjilG_22258 [Lupinus angustifolius]|uniref:Uncharacterized protein n=1 Tax=Lupinus angustifolius TaxID=3871 RepID=A0A1J7IL24_LUPAN|nr:PREDICTED: uncharacterized protein LOC109344838 [Lupinus angustifolius]OIW13467.1 hypothetical protein TanjilG_22258 [Lupinus angustifolius]
MEGERRKRKIENEEENEQENMEKFFALIKSTKDVRDLLYKEKIDKKVDDEKAKGTWIPKFQVEDFIDYGEFGRSNNITTTPSHASSSEKEKEKEKEKRVIIENEHLQEVEATTAEAAQNEVKEKAESDYLDLNLSL